MPGLAPPPERPLPEIDLAVPGGRLRRESGGLLTVTYAGLPPLRSWPEDTPHGRAVADATAGGDLFRANLAHELCHCVAVAKILGLPHSPTLFAAARRNAGLQSGWWPNWWKEEKAVLALTELAAAAGVDLVKLALEAAERE